MTSFREILDVDAVKSVPVEKKVQVFFQRTRGLHEFSEKQIAPVVVTQLQKDDYEKALAGTYYRMSLFVRAIVQLPDPCHFQVAAMAARSVFELLLDLKALVNDQSLVDKFYAFTWVDRFRKATKLKSFLDEHRHVDRGPHQAAIRLASDPGTCQRNEELCAQHWGRVARGKRAGQPNWPDHWSGKSAAERARDAGSVYEAIYRSDYGIQSYYVHAGGAGVINMSREALAGYFAISHDLLYRLFSEGTLIIADEFHLSTIDADLRRKVEHSSAVAAFGVIAQAMQPEARTGESE